MRWIALEAMATRTFTAASNTWALAVVCWEILSNGAHPYGNWADMHVVMKLTCGMRLAPPDFCPQAIYTIMCRCWDLEPKQRPAAREVLAAIEAAQIEQRMPDTRTGAQAMRKQLASRKLLPSGYSTKTTAALAQHVILQESNLSLLNVPLKPTSRPPPVPVSDANASSLSREATSLSSLMLAQPSISAEIISSDGSSRCRHSVCPQRTYYISRNCRLLQAR